MISVCGTVMVQLTACIGGSVDASSEGSRPNTAFTYTGVAFTTGNPVTATHERMHTRCMHAYKHTHAHHTHTHTHTKLAIQHKYRYL